MRKFIFISCLFLISCVTPEQKELDNTITEYVIMSDKISYMDLKEYRESKRQIFILDSLSVRIDTLSKYTPRTIKQLRKIIEASERSREGIEYRGKEEELEIKIEYLNSL